MADIDSPRTINRSNSAVLSAAFRLNLTLPGIKDLTAPDCQKMTARAIALGNRLLDIETQTFDLRSQLARMRRDLDAALDSTSGSRSGWFDVPQTRFPWPLVDRPKSDEPLTGYDCRVDDAVVFEGRRGEAFLDRFALTSDTPDFAAAVQALNALVPILRIIPAGSDEIPDVSVIIPVFGQLGYTLNCLESLFTHISRYSTEIIIIDDRSPDASGTFLPDVSAISYHLQPVNGGFIKSCNTGGTLARGRHFLMLNNDTRVVPGWLDALLDSFDIFPKAGLVGSKLCYADGTLQEAGGIIWRDGSCWNYGRNDDPNRPNYSHARQVDYISGCSIVIPAELWRELSGFDPLFTPAYCEDADLCLRLAAMGKEVWYQPQSRVVHYEGKTSGTDTSKGVKAYQVINNRKLYLRWRDSLERHRSNAEAPYFERERVPQRRMLVVDASTPTPKQDAGSVQTMLALRVCRDLGYKTHFVAEHNWLYHPEFTTDLQKMGIECTYAPYDLDFITYIRRFGHLFDVVMVYRVNVLEGILENIRKFAPQAALLYHVADLHFLRQQRQAQIEGSKEGLAEAEEIKLRELALVKAVDCTITHSSVEAEILGKEVPDATVSVWPLMIDFFGTRVKFAERRDICFLGGYRHPPNVDAVRYFVRDILPLLREVDPTIRFIIAGANLHREVLELAGDDVKILGAVDNLADLFDRARVFVCPLRVGAGAKGKVLSAMSYGIPIVSTSIGIEGTGLEDNIHVLVADDPQNFVKNIMLLYNNEKIWNRLSSNSQEIVRHNFSTLMGQPILKKAIYSAYAHKLGLKEKS